MGCHSATKAVTSQEQCGLIICGRKFDRRGHQIVLDHLFDDAEGGGFGRRQQIALDDHLEGRLGADHPGQAPRYVSEIVAIKGLEPGSV